MDGRFLEKLHDETLTLLEEARAYARQAYDPDALRRAARPSLLLAHEISRISTLLIDAMAWVLVWRAVDNEEMTRHEALAPKWRLMRSEALDDGLCEGGDIEPRLRRLSDASLELHRRLRRLELRLMDA